MDINLKEIKEESIKELRDALRKTLPEADKEDVAIFNFLNWISNLNAASKSEITMMKNGYVKLSSNTSNLFQFGYDHIVDEPFLGVYHELYKNIILNLPIKYIAIRESGILLALFERDKRVIVVIKSIKTMLKAFFDAHADKDYVTLRPHDYENVLAGKLKEIPLVKDSKTFKREFTI